MELSSHTIFKAWNKPLGLRRQQTPQQRHQENQHRKTLVSSTRPLPQEHLDTFQTPALKKSDSFASLPIGRKSGVLIHDCHRVWRRKTGDMVRQSQDSSSGFGYTKRKKLVSAADSAFMCILWSTNKRHFLESFIHGLRSNFNRQVPINIEASRSCNLISHWAFKNRPPEV